MEPLDERHAAALFDGFADGEVYRFIPSEPPATAETLAARYRRTAAGPPATSERWWNWAVFRSGDRSRALGTVELSLFENGQSALLAYVFARSAWGSGYAAEACGAAITYVRAHAPLQTVSALIDTRNERSIALVTRLGFVCAETIRDADHFKGRASHEYRYCLHLGTTVLSI